MLLISGVLNVISPIVANFYLATFTIVNYSCFDASLSKSPGLELVSFYLKELKLLYVEYIIQYMCYSRTLIP